MASQPPLTWVGERSYGIYLWHWPVILLVAAMLPATAPGSDPTLLNVVLCLGVTFGLAEASYRWIEMPVRRNGFRATWAAVQGHTVAVAGAGVLVALAVVAVVTAPEKTDAQLAVERGERAIAEQNRAAEGAGTTVTTQVASGPAWPPELAVPPGDLMVGFGDSILSGAAPAVYERFPGIVLDAEPIRQWRDAPAVVQQALDAGRLRPVVVLNFGTNAGLQSAESQQGLRSVLDTIGPSRRVVLVNTVGVSEWVPVDERQARGDQRRVPEHEGHGLARDRGGRPRPAARRPDARQLRRHPGVRGAARPHDRRARAPVTARVTR